MRSTPAKRPMPWCSWTTRSPGWRSEKLWIRARAALGLHSVAQEHGAQSGVFHPGGKALGQDAHPARPGLSRVQGGGDVLFPQESQEILPPGPAPGQDIDGLVLTERVLHIPQKPLDPPGRGRQLPHVKG